MYKTLSRNRPGIVVFFFEIFSPNWIWNSANWRSKTLLNFKVFTVGLPSTSISKVLSKATYIQGRISPPLIYTKYLPRHI